MNEQPRHGVADDELAEALGIEGGGAARLRGGVAALERVTLGRHPPVLDVEGGADDDDLVAKALEEVGAPGLRAGEEIGEAVDRNVVGAGVVVDQELALGHLVAGAPDQFRGERRHHPAFLGGKAGGVAAHHVVAVDQQVEGPQVAGATRGDDLAAIGHDGLLGEPHLAQHEAARAPPDLEEGPEQRLVVAGHQARPVEARRIDQVEPDDMRATPVHRLQHLGQKGRPRHLGRLGEGLGAVSLLVDDHGDHVGLLGREQPAEHRVARGQQEIDAESVEVVEGRRQRRQRQHEPQPRRDGAPPKPDARSFSGQW
jgi:hypothetical protein